MKRLILLILPLVCAGAYGQTKVLKQRSTLNHEDRMYLLKKLKSIEASLNGASMTNYKESELFTLRDQIELGFTGRATNEHCIELLNTSMIETVVRIYINNFREFPQFKKVKFHLNKNFKIYTFDKGRLEFYNDLKKQNVSIGITIKE